MRALLRWMFVAAWAAFIFYMSSHTASDLSHGMLGQLKAELNRYIASYMGYEADFMSVVAHFSEYFVFGILLANALRSHMGIGLAAILGIALASGYGITDEIHQLYVDGRFCDPRDWGTDTMGAALGALFAFVFMRKS